MPSSELVTRWSSRKFWAVMFWQGVNTGLVWFEKIPPDVYQAVTIVLLGAYVTGNVAQHIWEPKK